MRNAIVCEGMTDLTLIQYYMEKVNKWEYINKKDLDKVKEVNFFKSNRNFMKNGTSLCIGEVGGHK